MKSFIQYLFFLCIFLCSCSSNGTSNFSTIDSDTCCVVEDVVSLDTATYVNKAEVSTDTIKTIDESYSAPLVTIGREYYNFTVGKTSKSSALERVRKNGFQILSGTQDSGIEAYSCIKKFTWNNITWGEVDLYFKNNTLVGIAFAKACNSEVQAKHFLERVTYIYLDDYKSLITDKTSDYIFFDDHKTAMEIYGGDILMYLRISESSVAKDLI